MVGGWVVDTYSWLPEARSTLLALVHPVVGVTVVVLMVCIVSLFCQQGECTLQRWSRVG